MGNRSSNVALQPWTRMYAIVRLGREWQPDEVSRFKTDLTLREHLFVIPVVNTVNRTEIIFRSSNSEVAAIRRVLDDITPRASRPLLELVSAPSVDVAMNPGLREHV